eukprot:CAMPEP_0117684048 /NCGR_PEP_ID=MMETSP0804-20121206/20835_1 /TAXON_ID=1074897 /ORGANISM="Tetraselmis astigmatica, Strain CCMP880" /LENGTH=171 /DNA_ID=CAMNT_0005494901 /DNA_START=334 /DNA_END=850 /DNA_ORIENTATION=+
MADHGRTARATLPKDGPRKSNRARKVSQAMQRVDAEEQQHAVQARLDALENDNVEEAGAFGLASDDEEYVIEGSSDEGGGTRKRKGKTKGRKNSKRHDRPKMFSALLEEADLENQIDDGPNYLTAAAGPPQASPVGNSAVSVDLLPRTRALGAGRDSAPGNARLSMQKPAA